MAAFAQLGLDDWLVQQCKSIGLKQPTPIQQQCVGPILAGQDCIGCAKTGSGKTAAFALPILQKLSEDPYGIFALVLTPTRELAFQIADQFKVLGKSLNVRVTVITGGMDMMKQGQDLAVKPHIIISTPGRLADHIDSCDTFSLKRVQFLVMDEADRLLDDNFGAQLEPILMRLPAKRQTLLFSATLSPTVTALKESVLQKPFVWIQQSERATVEELKEEYVLMPASMKDAYLVHIIDKWMEKNPRSSVIVFAATCKYAQILGMVLEKLHFPCAVLHSMIPQRFRLSSLSRFKSNQTRILISTDVASRGLDIPTVDLIINHNIPNRPRDYVHRVGRTARAGRCGQSISLVTEFDIKLVKSIENHINSKMTEHPVKEKEVLEIFAEVAVCRREAEIKLDEQDFGEQKRINKRKKLIMEGKDPEEEEEEQQKKRRKTSGKSKEEVKKEKEQRKEKYKARFAKKKKLKG
ncbi:putative ATP-dependent RNA helicase DDX49 [Babylonia areolata]|uniref:putative ATP-dependent RNA helicase DDX49 n=1 Tax=Babylonia areolata TaxID=304850 RepID=UPI003FD2E6E1